MITTREEYLKNLVKIQLMENGDIFFPIPETEKIYKINLNTRTIEAPAYLSVTDDHEAEIIFFEVDRYFDLKDLATTTCIISYINAAGENFIYSIPYIDTTSKENKILMPWIITSDVSWKAGSVKFAFKFYEIDSKTLDFTYVLNTQPATTKVLQGLELKYIDATAHAATDYAAGKWTEVYNTYYIRQTNLTGQYKYVPASETYDTAITYYKREEELRAISHGTSLEDIIDRLAKLENSSAGVGSVKWIGL